MKSSDELRRELKEAEAREREAHEARKAECRPRFRYYIKPDDRKGFGRELFDPTCSFVRIGRTCLNPEEAKAAGWTASWDCDEGGMTYLWNHHTGRIVCATGGGTIYLSDRDPELFAKVERISERYAEATGHDVEITDLLGRES